MKKKNTASTEPEKTIRDAEQNEQSRRSYEKPKIEEQTIDHQALHFDLASLC